MVDLLVGHHAPHIAFAGRVPDHGGTAPQQHDGPVACPLHVGHGHQGHVMANMEAVCGGVKANVKGDLFPAQKLPQLLGMGALLQKAPFRQGIVNILHMIALLY